MFSLSRASYKRPTDEVYTGVFRINHGELLDLFFARLLPSGTGDFDAGPSQLREKQTNQVMIWPYPLTEHFLIEMEPAYTRILSFFPVSGSEGIPTILTRRCTRIARCEGYSPSAGPRPISTHARIRSARFRRPRRAFLSR